MTVPDFLEVFGDAPSLQNEISKMLAINPQHDGLIRNISEYVTILKRKLGDAGAEPATKKRKLDVVSGQNGAAGGAIPGGWQDKGATPLLITPDVSFSIPQRKKLKLEGLAAARGKPAAGGLRAVDATGNIEFGVGWKDIEQIFCLPVPERAKRAHNFVVMPYYSDGVTAPPSGITVVEPIVWTYQELSGKDLPEGGDPEPGRTIQTLNTQLAHFNKSVMLPDAEEFASTIPQPHRREEKAYHVKAFRGSKEGYLYFLPAGILFAFKKPLLFFPHSAIQSISYTSVLQRTFNLNITVSPSQAEQRPQEFEFSMVDQADYANIDAYIKRHGLNDASLAKERKAHRYGVNDPRLSKEEKEKAAIANANGESAQGTGGEGGEEEEEEETELQKAERMLQDAEDEEEEDYDPSGGESEGEEESSEEDEEYDEGGEGEVEGEEEEEEDEEGYEDEE